MQKKSKELFDKIHSVLTHHEKRVGLVLFAISLAVLIASSIYVGQKSGLIHLNNHDNLTDNYLFESPEVFKGALFPAAHTFLLKWPLFALSAAFGNTADVFVYGTIALYVLTVTGFMVAVFLLTRKNLHITALVGLALSLVLVMVPAQPSNGLLLPLNMAMITTRNIEFLLLFGFIYLILAAKKLLSWQFIGAVIIMSILGASDKFYLMISLVASVMYIGFLFSSLNKSRSERSPQAFSPLIAGAASYIVANIILVAIHNSGTTNVPGATGSSPFSLVTSMWKMFEAIAGGLQGIIANFGADIFGKSLGSGLAPYLLNGIILLAAAYSCAILLKRAPRDIQKTTEYKFTIWLILTFVGSFIIFIASEHSYTVDGRYLTGAIFAGFSAIALVLTTIKLKNKNTIVTLAFAGLLLVTPFYAYVARNNYARAFRATHNAIGERIDKAADILMRHDVDVFVGDYWFVSPVRLKTNNTVTPVLMSTEKCDTPNHFLTSRVWYQPSPSVKTSAVYILRDADPDAVTFNHGCSLDYLNKKYGKPDSEYTLRGTVEEPIDIIRIYSYDVREKLEPKP